MFQHNSDEMVNSFGGGEGNESVYADAVPNGSPVMV